MHDPSPVAVRVLALAAILLSCMFGPSPLPAQGRPVGFEETFALAEDRRATLGELIPGSPEFYFYACLLAQHEARFADVPPLLERWIAGHGRSAQVVEIENRQALLTFVQSPDATYRFLRDRLGLDYAAQRERSGVDPQIPTRLDAARLRYGDLVQRALRAQPGTVRGFTARGLWRFAAAAQVDDELLTPLLAELRDVDVPGLARLVSRQLALRDAGVFGSMQIHRALLREQLDEVVSRRPEVLDQAVFVETYLRRLRPSADVDWRRSATARERYLDDLQAFVSRLSPVHSALQAHVLHHRLAHDLAQGITDRQRLLAYLRLPRKQSYVEPEYLRRAAGREIPLVETGEQFPTGLPPLGADEALVRSHLERLFVTAGSYDAYAEYLREDWLRRVFAETKILRGVGDPQQWYALLADPTGYESLRDRVEIRFAPTAPEHFAIADAVALPIETKNVDKLIVRVFEIDTFNYLRQRASEVDASIQLEGLVANHERTVEFQDSPLRRVARELQFPSIPARRGVWVIELIGNGMSSRAVVRKGSLHCSERVGAAGHVFEVFDEAGRPVAGATLWFGGREYQPDEQGGIVVPFSTDGGRRQVLLRHDGFAAPASFEHQQEAYALEAGSFVARESLLAGQTARIVLQPRLTVQGVPISLQHLRDPVLEIVATDLDGLQSRQSVRDLELRDGADLVHEIRVPDRTTQIEVRLRSEIDSLSRAERVALTSETRTFEINGIDATPETSSPLLGRGQRGFVLDLLGKDGEPRADVAVQIEIAHADFHEPVQVTLRTDARGRVDLGPLTGVEELLVRTAAGDAPTHRFQVAALGGCSLPTTLHGAAGQTLSLPWPTHLGAPGRSAVTLFELRAGEPAYDRFDALSTAGGFLQVRGLTAGDYRLQVAGSTIAVRVTRSNTDDGGAAAHPTRVLGPTGGAALQIESIAPAGDDLIVRLANAGDAARVRVVATRYLPNRDSTLRLLDRRLPAAGVTVVGSSAASYVGGRELSDEARYILERRFARHFPGNMLPRPSLLLNPWALDTFESDQWNSAVGLGGGAGARYGGRGGSRKLGKDAQREGLRNSGVDYANLDFLGAAAIQLFDLRPDDTGVIRVPLAKLGDGHLLHVVATDDRHTVYQQAVLPEQVLEPVHTRLTQALDPDQDFAQQRRIEFVPAGGAATVADLRAADLEIYDSLPRVFQLFRSVGDGQQLDRFAFVLRWPSLDGDDKRALYAEHACHELHVFLHQKDPEFFAAVVRPYLANKLHKQFIDHWLLGDDLRGYLDPYAFGRLNVVERILLAKRVPSRAESVRRRLGDEIGLSPLTPAQQSRLVQLALKGDDLNNDAAGATLLLDEIADSLADDAPAARKPSAPRQQAEAAKEDADLEEPEEVEIVAGDPAAVNEYEESGGRPEPTVEQARRDAARRLFVAPGSTRVWVERNYWQLPATEQDAALIQANAFWQDFATSDPQQPFVSTHLVSAAVGSFAEAMLALAFLDLPFESADHTITREDQRLDLGAASPLLLVRQEIAAVERDSDAAPILVSQNVYRLDEPFRVVDGRRVDAYLTRELLTGVAYGCRVVVTNPTSAERDLQVLVQIPAGALPVNRGFRTRGMPLRLGPYATQSIEFGFYFPATAEVTQYPARVASAGLIIGTAAEAVRQWSVLAAPRNIDTTSWSHVSQRADTQAVHRHMWASNLLELDLRRIAWRMTDRSFYTATLALLRERQIYSDLLWSYALLHGDQPAAREFLQHQTDFVASCGPTLDSALLTIDPFERRTHQLAEFRPLFHARAHRFGERTRILNDGLATHYEAFLDLLVRRPTLTAEDLAMATCLLLNQDRVEAALDLFQRIDAQELPSQLQYDYLRCYLDFFTADHALARGIAERYVDHPVARWRDAFREVLAHLDAAERPVMQPDDESGGATTAIDAEPSLEFEIEGGQILIRYANLESVQLSCYRMDVEFLFSAQPFMQQDADTFGLVRPNHSDLLSLPAGHGELSQPLPAALADANVLVELRGGGMVRRQPHYANSLALRWLESHGQVQVADPETGRPLAAVYVKVYARQPNGSVRFHKDGYTDIRGRFDYVSVSGPDAMNVERLAVLVLDDQRGAVIREIAPPAR